MSEDRKVAIVGTAPSSYKMAPWDDEEWEIWGTSRLYHVVPRWDRWYEPHHLDYVGQGWECSEENRKRQRNEHLAWLAEDHDGKPVYVQERFVDRVANGRAYPIREILDYFEEEFRARETYITNSVSFMLAHAIYEAPTEVGVWGVDMSLDCIAPHERVLTADLEWVPAKELHEGDEILAFDELTGPKMPGDNHSRQWRVATIDGRSEATLPCYRIHFEDGTEIVASENHGWLTYGEHQMKWKTTKQLVTPMHREGRPTRIHSPIDTWEEDRSWQAGYLAAAFDGEGHITQTDTGMNTSTRTLIMAFAQRDNAMADKVRTILAEKGFDWGEYARNAATGTDGAVRKPTITYNIRGGRPAIMRLLGQIRPRRLLAGFDPTCLGQFTKKRAVAVTEIEPLGPQKTVGFTTSTGTMIVEGFASHNSEYDYQRPSCEYLIGVARGAGIPVYIPDEADLLKSNSLYGYDDDHPMKRKHMARKRELQDRIQKHKQSREDFRVEARRIEGALTQIQSQMENGVPPSMREELQEQGTALQERLQQLSQKVENTQRKIDRHKGALENNDYWGQSWL